MIINFTLFSPSKSVWMAFEYMYETSVIGLALPARAIAKPFIPNIFETSREKGLRTAEFLRFFLVFYIFAIIIVKRIVQLKSLSKIFKIEMLIHLGSDMFIVCITITIFALCIQLSSSSTQDLLDSEQYVDYVQKAYLFHLIFILEGYLFLVLLIKLIYIVSVSRAMKIAILSFGLAIKQLLAYALLIFPIICCIAVICMQIWGSYDKDYRTFMEALKSMFYLMLGQGEAYIVMGIFIAIYSYSFGLTILSEGYPEPSERFRAWKVRPIIRWLVGWMPNNLLKKLKLLDEMPEQDSSIEEEKSD